MGLFNKFFKGPEIDQAKSDANRSKMRACFDQAVENGTGYKLAAGYTEDVSRFNYGLVHGSKSKIGSLIVGWNEQNETIVVVPTTPDLDECGNPVYSVINIQPMLLSSIRIRRVTSRLIFLSGWKMKATIFILIKRLKQRPLPISL